MPEFPKSDRFAYKTAILYETLHGNSAEQTYQNLKQMMPNLDYIDFEYWYYRFLDGNHDFNHERSMDPKPRLLSDMPDAAVEKIMEKLGLVDRLTTRKVCRRFRTVIDEQKAKCSGVSIHFDRYNDSQIRIKFENRELEFNKKGNDNCISKVNKLEKRYPGSITEKEIRGDFWKLARKELSIILNPNWIFKSIEIDFGSNGSHDDNKRDKGARLNYIKSILLGSKRHVEELIVNSYSLTPPLALFPDFDAKSIQSIIIRNQSEEREMMGYLVKSDHWKNSKSLEIRFLPNWFPIDELFHAKRITVLRFNINRDRLYRIRDILFKRPTFEYLFLSIECATDELPPYAYNLCFYDPYYGFEEVDLYDELKKDFRAVIGVHPQYDSRSRRFRISNSNEYFAIEVGRSDVSGYIEIVRRKN